MASEGENERPPRALHNRAGRRPGPPGRRQYDTFLKNKLIARDVLVDLHLNLALFAFPPRKNIDFLILFAKGVPRRAPRSPHGDQVASQDHLEHKNDVFGAP